LKIISIPTVKEPEEFRNLPGLVGAMHSSSLEHRKATTIGLAICWLTFRAKVLPQVE